MSDPSSNGLAEFRKNLHTLLHSNDNIPDTPRKAVNRVNIQVPRAKRLPSMIASTKSDRRLDEEIDLERKKWEQEKNELQNVIEVKNNKILTLSKANLERAEAIKVLNEKVERLEKSNSQKDTQIDQLERVILRLQNLSRVSETGIKKGNSSTKPYNDYEDEDEYDNEESIDEEDDDEYKSSAVSHSDDEDNLHEATISLLNSKNTVDLDKELNLNTQQLMDLDLRHLSFKASSEPAIYNSNTTDDPYNNDSDSDLEKYLFSV